MKFSKEARIGLLVALSLLIFFAGFYFLKGANLFSGENDYVAYYDDVLGLLPSAAVQVKGMTVGRVTEIVLDENGKVKVGLAVKKSVAVPKGTIAKLTSADLLGTKVIALELGQGPGLAEVNSTLAGAAESSLMENLTYQLTPLINDVRTVVGTLDTLLQGVNMMLGPDTRSRLSSSIVSLDETMENFSQLSAKLNNESQQLASIISNTNSITTNLAENNGHISQIIANTEQVSKQLADAPLDKVLGDLKATTEQMKSIMAKINSNEGSLGMLVNDKQLYENLSLSLKTMDALMADIKSHPSRYINVTIFGRKNKDTH